MSRPRPARLPKTLAPHKVLRSLPGSLQPVLKAREVELGKEEINTRFKRFRKRVGALSRAVLDPTNAVQQESALNIAKACSSFVAQGDLHSIVDHVMGDQEDETSEKHVHTQPGI